MHTNTYSIYLLKEKYKYVVPLIQTPCLANLKCLQVNICKYYVCCQQEIHRALMWREGKNWLLKCFNYSFITGEGNFVSQQVCCSALLIAACLFGSRWKIPVLWASVQYSRDVLSPQRPRRLVSTKYNSEKCVQSHRLKTSPSRPSVMNTKNCVSFPINGRKRSQRENKLSFKITIIYFL